MGSTCERERARARMGTEEGKGGARVATMALPDARPQRGLAPCIRLPDGVSRDLPDVDDEAVGALPTGCRRRWFVAGQSHHVAVFGADQSSVTMVALWGCLTKKRRRRSAGA